MKGFLKKGHNLLNINNKQITPFFQETLQLKCFKYISNNTDSLLLNGHLEILTL